MFVDVEFNFNNKERKKHLIGKLATVDYVRNIHDLSHKKLYRKTSFIAEARAILWF